MDLHKLIHHWFSMLDPTSWRQLVRKFPVSSVHTNPSDRRFFFKKKKYTLESNFKTMRFRGADSLAIRVDGRPIRIKNIRGFKNIHIRSCGGALLRQPRHKYHIEILFVLDPF